jgi:NNP family nitrate/nitrite transporter-like MFS transporter
MKHNISGISDEQDKNSLQAQLLPLFFLTSIFFLNFIIRIIISPLMPTILADMNLTRDQAGSFFLVSASGYFISLLCSGFVSSRLQHKRTIVFSAVATGIAFIATGLSQDLLTMRLGLFVVGMTSALYIPSGIAMLTSSISSRHWGKAISIHEMAPNLGFLMAPIISEGLLLWLSWRSVLMVIGGASILTGISFLKFSNVMDFPGESPRLKSVLPLVKTPSFWMMMTLFSLGVAGTMGVYSMLPLYLVNECSMIQSQANTLITLSRILTLPMSLMVGWLSDRFGLKQMLAAVLLLTGISTLLIGLLSGRLMTGVIFCQPVLAVCFFPPAFAALSHIGSKETRNIAVSFTIPFAFLVGGGVVPTVIGILGEKGFFSMGFVVAGALILFGAVIPFFLKFQEDN